MMHKQTSRLWKRVMMVSLSLIIYHLSFSEAQAQNNNPFGSARGGFGGNNSAFNQNRVNNFNEYRQKINAEYISKTREKWNAFRVSQPLPVPDKDVPLR